MKNPLQPYAYPVIHTVLMLIAAALLLPEHARAECQEFKIVEYEDRVEAVCVGEPLTEAQKKVNQEEERRQALEAQRLRVEEKNRQEEAARAGKIQEEAEARKRNLPPAKPQMPNTPTTTNPQIIYK